MLEAVMEANGEINGRSFGGYTPLHLAAIAGHNDIYNRLLALGITV